MKIIKTNTSDSQKTIILTQIESHQEKVSMIDAQQFLGNIASAVTNRPHQQSSPSDQSASSSSPPHHISRVSPASTALVMSSNNINAAQSSRQLTPNTSSSNNGGTSSSTSSAGNNQQTQQQTQQHFTAAAPPNPMVRQFAYHSKSMSAGVVVSVPGISNGLATAAGMNQSNMINNNIANHHRPSLPTSHEHPPNGGHHIGSHHPHHQQRSVHQQQVLRENQISARNHHHQQHSQPSHLPHHQLQQNQRPHQQTMPNHVAYNPSQNGSSHDFVSARQATSSSITLSNNNINNIHNRSASTHLSNVILGPPNPQSNHHNTNSRHNYQPHVTNSIWSIDENISKSHGKLTSSSYIPHPYLFNASITDMSCDNVSNASRLIDGAPAPGYYLHAPPTNLPNSNALSASGSIKAPEFLPICDLMFNLISMIIYFCENTFAIIALIALYYHTWFTNAALLGAAFIFISNFLCQYVSFKWLYKSKLEDCRRKREAQVELEDEEDCERRYYNRMSTNMRNYQCGSCAWLPDSATEVQLKFLLSIAIDAVMHIFCLGFLVRYIKLVIPVTDTARVKKEARDLSMLRMMHGFAQSAPLLLIQAYVSQIAFSSSMSNIFNLSLTSAILSLVSVCWALASFTKYARKKYIHKFVLTWLGIVSQFLWRLGTVSSRVVALTIYAVYYNNWMLVVLFLHWIVMFLWLIKPGNLLRDEVNLSRSKKVTYAMATAWVYCFCYMNFEEHNSKLKMTSYYLIMFLENNLLLTVCLLFSSQVTWFKTLSIMVVYLGFVVGMLFMFVYYKCFHVKVLNNGLSCSQESIDSIADQLSPAGKKIAGFQPGTLIMKSEDSLTSGHRYNSNINATLRTGSHPEITRKPPYLTSSHAPLPHNGVFNCKLNTGFKKQKIPSSHPRRHNP